jgi:hypothetical protein
MIKRVEHNGNMHWTATHNLEVTCEADVSKYPFDTHKCFLLIFSLSLRQILEYKLKINLRTLALDVTGQERV